MSETNRIARIASAEDIFSEGQALLARGRYQSAVTKFKTVIAMAGASGASTSAMEKLKAIQDEGLKFVNKARQLFQAGDIIAARRLAEKTLNQFGNVFSGVTGIEQYASIPKLCRALISEIDSLPEKESIVNEAQAAKKASNLDILEYKASKDDRVFYDLYRTLEFIARQYPDSPTGHRCATRKKELQQDKRIYEIIQREKDRRFIAAALQSADQYLKNGLPAKAEAELGRLRKRFPESSLEDLRQRAQ